MEFKKLCRVTVVLRYCFSRQYNANKYFFLLLVIVMDSIKSNVSVNFVEGIQ